MKQLFMLLLAGIILTTAVATGSAYVTASVKPFYEFETKGTTLIIRTNMSVIVNPENTQ